MNDHFGHCVGKYAPGSVSFVPGSARWNSALCFFTVMRVKSDFFHLTAKLFYLSVTLAGNFCRLIYSLNGNYW